MFKNHVMDTSSDNPNLVKKELVRMVQDVLRPAWIELVS